MTPLQELGASAVAEAWNAAVPAKYWIDALLVEQNLLDHSLFHDEASFAAGSGFAAVKRSAAGLYDGPDPRVAHLSLFTPDAQALTRSIDVLRQEGYAALVVGTDSGHFLPGVPTDVPWMGLFLKSRGFVPGGLAFDLERDLAGLPEGPFDLQYAFRTVLPDDLEAVDRFLAREFPTRWRYDVTRKVEAEGPSTLFGLFSEGACEGFALLQEEGCTMPIGGAVWQSGLGPRWGSLGPIGISEKIRGGGLGKTFLNRALVELRDRGTRQTIIDWTGLVDFYGTQGFSVTRAYRSYRLNLLPGPESSA